MAEFILGVADADQVRIAVASIPISRGAGQSGYADGEYFTADLTTDSFITVVGTDGTVARAKTNNRLVDMSLNLLQTSASNDILSQLWASDNNNPNGAGVGSFVVEDLQGTTLLLCTRAWIKKPAPVSLDRGPKERKWPFVGIFSVWNIGSN